MITSHKTRLTHVQGALPGPRSGQLLEQWHRYEADVVGYQAPIVWDSARGCRVRDVDGNRYLDWTSGVLVTNVGHCHPHLVDAIRQASEQLLNNYECASVQRIRAAERLVKALPEHLDRCFFLSTGSETTEAACRLMKRFTGKYEIVAFHGGFHGRTAAAAAMGGLPSPKRGFGPCVPGVIRLPYPNPYRDPLGWCEGAPQFEKYFDHIEEVLNANSTGSLAGVMVEPYQGTAGFVFPPVGWLRKLEEWARGKGLLLTLDEVQSACGRTGTMWAMEHEGVQPDIVTIGKGIGSGIPVSAVASRAEIFACLNKGEMSSTMGGNPVAAAAVIAVLDILEREKLVENAREMGAHIFSRLSELRDLSPWVGDTRGMGLVGGIEFVQDRTTKEPAPKFARAFIDMAAQHGLLFGAVGMHGNVIRVGPPLVISREEADQSLEIIESIFRQMGA